MKTNLLFSYLWVACVLLAVLAAPLALDAQSTSGSVAGRVVDAEGAPAAGAELTIRGVATGLERRAVANEKGGFTFPNLPPGEYQVHAVLEGFQDAESAPLVLNVNDRREINLTMLGAEETTDVQVKVQAAPGFKSTPALSTVVDLQYVSELPLNGRSFQSLITLPPGGLLVPSTPERRSDFSFNGVRPTGTYVTIDGVSATYGVTMGFDPALSEGDGVVLASAATGGTNTMVAVDSMREFKVQTSTYAPEFGRGAGGQISIATRSGTNQFHGSLFNYFRNEKLDANDWFSNRDGLDRAPLRQNDFGGVLGGPVVRDRTFFFGSYEGFRLREPQFANQVYPTAEVRERAAPWVRPLVDLYPIPNREDVGGGLGRFVTSYTSPSELDAYSGRVDHVLSGSMMLFGRFSHAPSSLVQRGPESPTEGSATNAGTHATKSTSATVGLIQMIGASVSNELRGNFSRSSAVNRSTVEPIGGAILSDPSPALLHDVPLESSFLAFLGAGLPAMAIGSIYDNVQDQWAFVDTLTYIRGNHEIRAGVDIRRLAPSYRSPRYSQVAYFAGLDGPVGMLSGVAAQVQIQEEQDTPLEYFNSAWFIQDTWRASSRVSLTYGLRWDYNPAPGIRGKEVYPVINPEDPATATLGTAGDPLYRLSKTSFAPRLGVAYRLSNRSGLQSVLRGGVGLYYDLPLGAADAVRHSEPYSRSTLLRFTPYPLADPEAHRLPFDPAPPYGILTGFASDIAAPRVWQWSLGLDQGLGGGRVARISYAGSAGRHLWRREAALAPRADVERLELLRSDAQSDYHSLQVQVEQPLHAGLQLFAAYTWAHAIDTASDTATHHYFNESADLNRGSSDFDVRHKVSSGVTYNLPRVNGWAKPLVNGWGVDAVVQLQSAFPITPVYLRSHLSFVSPRPDLTGAPVWLEGPQYPGGKALNPAAFSESESGGHGSLGRNALRAFPLHQVDLAVRRKLFQIEGVTLQLKAEMFNAFNSVSFAAPTIDLESAMFGLSTKTYGRGLGGGGVFGGQNPLHSSGGPRSTQLSLRLSF